MGFFDWLLGRKDVASEAGPTGPSDGRPQPPHVDVALETVGRGGLTESLANFGLDVGRGAEANLVCSAYSIYEAWLRVWAGSVGDCRAELDEALGLSDASSVQQARSTILAALQAAVGTDCELRTANTLFVRPGLRLHDAFESSWGGATQELDFTDKMAAADAVNGWVSEKTNAMIDKIVDARTISDGTALMIANAIYLDAKWDDPFEAHVTRQEPFTLLDGTRVEVPTMVQMTSYQCAATPDFELLRKPYVGEALDMVIVLPRSGRFAVVRDTIRWAAVDQALDAIEPLLTTLFLPKFSVETSPEIDPLLKARGAHAVYAQATADLSAMSPDAREPGAELFVANTAHRARIDVDEEGTRAAAATVIAMQAGSAPPRPYEFRVNRPFLYFIVERATRTPLFSGQVVDPR